MSDDTPRFALPLLAAGQAQKEIMHNEALAAIDALLHPLVQSVGDNVPPSSPAVGEAWIVGAAPVGAWAGRAQAMATWTAGGWRFTAARTGMAARVAGSMLVAERGASGWTVGQVAAASIRIGGVQVVGARAAAIADPTGGGTTDTQARSAIGSILVALRTHGLIS